MTNEEKLLEKCYENSIRIAEEYNLESIAFPNISTGVYGFPKQKAAKIAIETVKKEAVKVKSIRKIIFCIFDDENLNLYREMV